MKIYKTIADLNEEILSKLEGEAKRAFKQGLSDLQLPGSELRTAFKRLLPNKSDFELDILVNPEKYR